MSMVLKLVYAPGDRRLLGLQAVGAGDVCRRIDVFSAFLRRGESVDDLFGHEHGYAPPFAEALDPLHHLAAMAQAQEGGVDFVSPALPDDLAARSTNPGHTVWLDVREAKESEASLWTVVPDHGKVVNIPLSDLRENLEQLDRSARVMIVCRRGPRSYQAARILTAAGFDNVHVISGGTTAVDMMLGK